MTDCGSDTTQNPIHWENTTESIPVIRMIVKAKVGYKNNLPSTSKLIHWRQVL